MPPGTFGRTTAGLPLVYGTAHGGKTLFWAASDLYFAFYMNEVCGIAPAITGLILGGSIFVAALADLLTGRAFAGRIGGAAQAGRLQLAGSVASGAALLLFAGTAFAPSAWRVIACIATLLSFRLAYAVMDIPQNALLSLAPGDERERSAMVAMRTVTGGVARVALAILFLPIMAAASPVDAAPRFFWLTAAMTVAVIAGAALLARHIAAPTMSPPERLPTARPLGIAGHCLRMVVASAMLTAVVQLEPYLATRAIADRNAGMALMIAIAVGAILSQPLWRRSLLAAPARLWPATLGATAIAGIVFAVLPLQTMAGSMAAGLAYGVASGGILFAIWAAFARAGRGDHALLAYARFTAAAKLGQGCAIVVIGLLLQYAREPAGQAATAISPIWVTAILVIGALLLFADPMAEHRTMDRQDAK